MQIQKHSKTASISLQLEVPGRVCVLTFSLQEALSLVSPTPTPPFTTSPFPPSSVFTDLLSAFKASVVRLIFTSHGKVAVREGHGRKGAKKKGRAQMFAEAPLCAWHLAWHLTCVVSCHLHNHTILQMSKPRLRKRWDLNPVSL